MAKTNKESNDVFTLKPTRPRTGNPKRGQKLVLFYKGKAYNLSPDTVEMTEKTAKRTGKVSEKKVKIKPASSAELKALYDSSPAFQKLIQAPAEYAAPWATK